MYNSNSKLINNSSKAVQEERGPRMKNKPKSSSSSNYSEPYSNSRKQNTFFSSKSLTSSVNNDSLADTSKGVKNQSHYRLSSLHCKSTKNIGTLLNPIVHRPSFPSVMFSGVALQYEIAAQIFLTTIHEAKNHGDFSQLDEKEQNIILRRSWLPLFVLRAATWPIDLTALRKSSPKGDKHWKDEDTEDHDNCGSLTSLAVTRHSISTLYLDHVELSILETLALCRPEIASSPNGCRIMSRAKERAIEILMNHLDVPHGCNNSRGFRRLAQLMLILPILTECCPRELVNDLFFPIIGDSNLERVIDSIH